MTYDELTKLLVKLRLRSTLFSLRQAVTEEAQALLKITTKQPRLTARVRADALKLAQDYYAEDISSELKRGIRHLQPHEILGLRRIPTAWAIAALIRAEQAKKGE